MIDVSKLSVRAQAAYRIAEKLSQEYKDFGFWLPGQFDTYVEMCHIVGKEDPDYWRDTAEIGDDFDETD